MQAKLNAVLMTVAVTLSGATSAHAAKRGVKLHPVKAACIDYTLSGQMQKGTMTRCHRAHGYEQVEIRDVTMGVAGFTQSDKKHVITIGETIYSIDPGTLRGTKTKNPMYKALVKRMRGKSPQQMSDAFIAAMGFKKTNRRKKVAGLPCSVYEAPQLGTACLTKDGLMLEQEFMGNRTVATRVRRDGGPSAPYQLYKKAKITAGPDLSKVRGLGDFMKRGRDRQ